MIERKWPSGRRLTDWKTLLGLAGSIGVLIGFVWAAFAYPIQWTDDTGRLNRLEPQILKIESRVTQLEHGQEEAHGDMKAIIVQLQDIKENVHYIRQHGG